MFEMAQWVAVAKGEKAPDGWKVKSMRGRPPQGQAEIKDYLAMKAAVKSGATIYESPEEEIVIPADETDAEIISRIDDRFTILNELTEAATVGAVRSLVVSGAGGVGKTYTVERLLDNAKEQYNIQTEIVRGVLSAVNLYMLLYRNRNENCVVVLDDADSIFYDEQALSILKAALDTSLTRKISWMAESHALKEKDVPPQFEYNGSMIFITNIDFQMHIDTGKTKLTPHLQALMTRAMYLDLKLHTDRELVVWINHMVMKNHILVQAGLTHKQEKEVLEYLNENINKLRNVSIRTALQLAAFVKAKPENNEWKKVAGVICLR
jgi:hypothetical protein